MTRKDIIKEMEARGYSAVEREIVKNGVVFEAICVQLDKQAGVLLYPQKQIECAEKTNQSIGEVVNELLKAVEAARNEKPSLSQVPDREFMKSHVYVALQKDSTEELERKKSPYEGIEEYLYIRNGNYSSKITANMMKTLPYSREDLWQWGTENTVSEVKIENMATLISRFCGEHISEEEFGSPLYIISNVGECMGASAILAENKLKELANRLHASKLVVLPSSVHEMIVLPYTDEETVEWYSRIVKSVNAKQVKPEERLTDRAYIISI